MPPHAIRGRPAPPAPARGTLLWIASGIVATVAIAFAKFLAVRPGGSPVEVMDCATETCRQEWAVAHWGPDHEAVMRLVHGTADPIARIALVEKLVEARPETSRELCPTLADATARQRCAAMAGRPHLWNEAEESADASESAIVPGLDVGAGRRSPWESEAPLIAACEGGLPRNTCQWVAARTAAADSRTIESGRNCLAMEGDRWRQECFFQTAAFAFYTNHSDRVGSAVRLCLGSGPYLRYCLSTITDATVRMAPSAAWGDPDAWRRVSAAVRAVREGLREFDPDLADSLADGIWSVALAGAYSRVATVGGNPLRGVDEDAIPFVRAAAAWRLVALEGDVERSADAWVRRLDEALATGATDPTAPPNEPWELAMLREQPTATRLASDLPRVPYLWSGERVLAQDPTVDATICVLEAAGRRATGHTALVVDALASPEPAIRATAEHILRGWGYMLDPSGTTVVGEPPPDAPRGTPPRPLELRDH